MEIDDIIRLFKSVIKFYFWLFVALAFGAYVYYLFT